MAANIEREKAAKPQEKEEPLKDFGLVAVSSGSGLDEMFKELGVDVLVSGGQTMLKSVEGAAKGMSGMLKKAFKRNLWSKIGYLLTKKGLKDMKEALDPKKTGGALLLGVNGVVVKAHGR